MKCHPEICFHSDFPDDGIEDGEEIIEPAGRNIIEVLKTAFEILGYQVSEPINAHDHGWEIEFRRKDTDFWLNLSVLAPDENYLMVGTAMWFWPQQYKYRPFLIDLDGILKADPRFREIGWYRECGASRRAKPASGPFG